MSPTPLAQVQRALAEALYYAPSFLNEQAWQLEIRGRTARYSFHPSGVLSTAEELSAGIALASADDVLDVAAAERQWTIDARSATVRIGSTLRAADLSGELDALRALIRARGCNRIVAPGPHVGQRDAKAIAAAGTGHQSDDGRGTTAATIQIAGSDDEASAYLVAVARRTFSAPLQEVAVGAMRLTRRDARVRGDGVDIGTMGLDLAQVHGIWEHVRAGGSLPAAAPESVAAAAAQSLAAPSTLVFFGAPIATAADFRAVGRSVWRVWREATRRGIGVHPVGAGLLLAANAKVGARRRTDPGVAALARLAGLTDPPVFALRLHRAPGPVAWSARRRWDTVVRGVTEAKALDARARRGDPPAVLSVAGLSTAGLSTAGLQACLAAVSALVDAWADAALAPGDPDRARLESLARRWRPRAGSALAAAPTFAERAALITRQARQLGTRPPVLAAVLNAPTEAELIATRDVVAGGPAQGLLAHAIAVAARIDALSGKGKYAPALARAAGCGRP